MDYVIHILEIEFLKYQENLESAYDYLIANKKIPDENDGYIKIKSRTQQLEKAIVILKGVEG